MGPAKDSLRQNGTPNRPKRARDHEQSTTAPREPGDSADQHRRQRERAHCCARSCHRFPRSTRGRARARHGVFGMTSKDWIDRMITARLAEHDERVSLRRAGKAATAGEVARRRARPGARRRGAGSTPRAEEQALCRPNEGRASMPAQGPTAKGGPAALTHGGRRRPARGRLRAAHGCRHALKARWAAASGPRLRCIECSGHRRCSRPWDMRKYGLRHSPPRHGHQGGPIPRQRAMDGRKIKRNDASGSQAAARSAYGSRQEAASYAQRSLARTPSCFTNQGEAEGSLGSAKGPLRQNGTPNRRKTGKRL